MSKKCICPHCGAVMDPIRTPLDSSWGGEIHHVCFNNECRYYVHSWETLDQQGIEGTGYRCRVDFRGACGALAVWSEDALRDLIVRDEDAEKGTLDFFDESDFARDDETNDAEYHKNKGSLDKLDAVARAVIGDFFEDLIPKHANILDLMAGADSHIKEELKPSSVTGLGLNEAELDANPALTTKTIHDVNADTKLPFDDETFDVVVNTNAVQYVKRPIELFSEVARVLKPGGTVAVVFSNRMFPQRAVHIWRKKNDAERIDIVKDYLSVNDKFFPSRTMETTGKPRPEDDEFYSLGIPSDPIYVVWAKVMK